MSTYRTRGLTVRFPSPALREAFLAATTGSNGGEGSTPIEARPLDGGRCVKLWSRDDGSTALRHLLRFVTDRAG